MLRQLRILSLLVFASCTSYHLGSILVEPTGGAGFAGIRTATLIQQPALSIDPKCTTHCSASIITDSLDISSNRHYEWRPSLSTGVLFQHYDTTGLGVGLGMNMVFIPGSSGTTSPWPAVTIHLGTKTYGFFAGFVISPTDKVLLPDGVSSIRVQRDKIPNLIQPNIGKAGNLIFGLQLGKSYSDSSKK